METLRAYKVGGDYMPCYIYIQIIINNENKWQTVKESIKKIPFTNV